MFGLEPQAAADVTTDAPNKGVPQTKMGKGKGNKGGEDGKGKGTKGKGGKGKGSGMGKGKGAPARGRATGKGGPRMPEEKSNTTAVFWNPISAAALNDSMWGSADLEVRP